MLAVLAVLGLAITFWFLVAQHWITVPTESLGARDLAEGNQNGNQRDPDTAASPFRDSQQERAQQDAQVIIDEFTEIQDSIDKNQYGNDSQRERYTEILARANNGDLLFGERKFLEAIDEYELALQEINQLLDDMNSEFIHWFEQGEEALNNRDYDAAVDAFSRAQDIEPLNSEVELRLVRVQLLPRINTLIRESTRAQFKEDWVQALVFLDDVVQTDPLTQGITELRTALLEKINAQDLNTALTKAHRHLTAQEFDEAEQAFKAILLDHPESIPAQTGLRRVERARLAAQIEDLRMRSREKEDELDMRGALALYNEALELDSSLQFATEGRQRVFEIISSISAMREILGDQHALSTDEIYKQAKDTLVTAQTHQGHSEEYDTLLKNFTDLVNYAGTQLTVILISDNATEVTLTTRQQIGVFDRYELTLRPGRYSLHGSRDGWVDVRKTFVVERDMEPILIVCEEPI